MQQNQNHHFETEKFVPLHHLPKLILFELPFHVNKKKFEIKESSTTTTKKLQENEESMESSSSSYSPIIDGFLGGIQNIISHTYGAQATSADPKNLNPNYPPMRRPLDLVSFGKNENEAKKITSIMNEEKELLRRHGSSSSSSSSFNNIMGHSSSTSSTKMISQFLTSSLGSSTVVPYVEGKCSKATDIAVRVTYTRKTITKLVTRIRVVKKKNNDKSATSDNDNTRDRAENENKQQQQETTPHHHHGAILYQQASPNTTTSMHQSCIIDQSSFVAQPVGLIKWSVEFVTPADWAAGMQNTANTFMTMMANRNHNNNATDKSVSSSLLPAPAFISTQSGRIRKVISNNRCQSPFTLMNTLRMEGKLNNNESNNQDDSTSSMAQTVRAQQKFRYSYSVGAVEIKGDLESEAPMKLSAECLQFITLPRLAEEYAALRRLFRIYPNWKLFTIERLIGLLFEVSTLVMVDTFPVSAVVVAKQKLRAQVKKENQQSSSGSKQQQKTPTNNNNNNNNKKNAAKDAKPKARSLKITIDSAKIIARSCTYCFSSGPFRLYRIRYGYDPRKQPRDVHFRDQICVFKTRPNARKMLTDVRNIAMKTFSSKFSMNNNSDSSSAVAAGSGGGGGTNDWTDGLRKVLVEIRNDFIQKRKDNRPEVSLPSIAENFLPEHAFFSRLLVSDKRVFFLCIGDYVTVPKYKKIIDDHTVDTFQGDFGWISKKGWVQLHDAANEGMAQWLVDVVSPKFSNVKVVDFSSSQMPMLDASRHQQMIKEERRGAVTEADEDGKKSNKKKRSKNEENDEDDYESIFGAFYTGGENKSTNNNNSNNKNHQKAKRNRNSSNSGSFDDDEEDADDDEFNVDFSSLLNDGNDENNTSNNNNNNNNNNMMMMSSGNRRQRANNNSNNETVVVPSNANSRKPAKRRDDDDDDLLMAQAFGFDDMDIEGGYREKSSEFEL